MYSYPNAIINLIKEFNRLPGIGQRSAEKLAFNIFKYSSEELERFVNAIQDVHLQVRYCKKCFNLSEQEICSICEDQRREKHTICVIETFKDVIAMEKTSSYNGQYHILQGLISPINGIFAEDLRIKELINRIVDENINELILALNPTTEGEGTSMYIVKELANTNIKITQLSRGIPLGGEIEFADTRSLGKALDERKEYIV